MRKYRVSALVFFILIIIAFGCQTHKIESYKDICIREKCVEWLDSLCSKQLMGRKTGSMYDSLAFNCLCKNLTRIGYTYDVQEFSSFGGNSSLRNIIIQVPGASDNVIIIGAHYDGAVMSKEDFHYPAANDNASGVVTVMALLDTLKRSVFNPTPSLICAFWDGEEVYDGSWVQGSRHFVRTYPDDKNNILFYLNLDSVGHDHVLYIKHKGHGYVDDVLESLTSNKRLSYVTIDMNNNNGGSSDYVPFGQNGIPYISFGDHNGDICSFASHSPNDIVDAISLDRIVIHVENIMDIIK